MKKIRMRKVISIILALALVLTGTSAFAGSSGYDDVDADSWYYLPIAECTNKGIMVGTGNRKFEPNTPMTRAMFVKALSNMATTYEKPNYGQRFEDVKKDAWYYDAVQWAAELNLVEGNRGLLGPNDELTREEMAVIIYRYAKRCTPIPELNGMISPILYKDFEKISGCEAQTAITWATKNGYLSGKGNGFFAPQDFLTRAETATVLTNIIEFNNPRYDTYTEEVKLNGKTVLTLELPTHWKNNCIVTEYIDSESGDARIRFSDKNNYIEHDGTKTYGHIFTLVFTENEHPASIAPRHGEIGQYIGEKEYNVFVEFPSDVQGFQNWSNWVLMCDEAEYVLDTLKFSGINDELVVDGKTILTVPMPNTWKDKYVVGYATTSGGRPTITFYEKLNHEDSSLNDGRVFSIILVPDTETVELPVNERIARIVVDGKRYSVYAWFPSDVRYDHEDPIKRNAYMELYTKKHIPINNIVFSDDVIVREHLGVPVYKAD